MTRESDTREKIRGLFLATLMVLSVVAGTAALSGGAAAAGPPPGANSAQFSNNNAAANQVSSFRASVNATNTTDTIQINFTSGGFDGTFSDVQDSDVNVKVWYNTSSYPNDPDTTFRDDAVVSDVTDNGRTINVSLTGEARIQGNATVRVVIQDNFVNPTSGGNYVGGVTLFNGTVPSNTVTGVLGVRNLAGAPPGPSFDANWTSNTTRWQGQTLQFVPANPGATYQVRRFNPNNNNVGQLVRELDTSGGGSVFIDTSTLEGYYVITKNGQSLTDVVDVNQNGVEVGVGGPHDVEIVVQTLSTQFDPGSVAQGGSGSLEIDSNRAGYQITVSSDGADPSRFFNDVNANLGGVQIAGSADGSVNVNVPNSVATGDYDFELNVTDTTASDTSTLRVTPPGAQTASFDQNVYTQERGDNVTITVNMTNIRTASVNIGSDDVNYEAELTLVDGNNDGKVGIVMDTYAAGFTTVPGFVNPTQRGYTPVNGTDTVTIESQTNLTATSGRPLDAAEYDLTVSFRNQEKDVSVLSLRERSLVDARTWTAPSGFEQTTPSSDYNTPAEILNDVSQDRTTAEGDLVVTQFEATGVSSWLADNNVRQFRQGNGFASISIREANTGPNLRGDTISNQSVNFVLDPANDTFYIWFDSDLDAVETNQLYNVTFTLPVTNPYVPNTQANRQNPPSLTTQFRVVDRTAMWDTNDMGRLEVEAAAGQTISGTTSVAAGTQLNVRVKATGENAFLRSQTVTVEQGEGRLNTFSATYDVFQNVDANTTFEASIRGAGFDNNAQVTGIVQPKPTATVTFNDQSTAGSQVTVASASLSDGGFVTIHDASLQDGAVFDSVRGSSTYLAPGEHSNIQVTLDDPIEESQTLIAMPHLDTNGNQRYDFVTSEGAADGPYTMNGSAVVDPASVTFSTPTPTPTATPTPTPTATPTPTPTEPPTEPPTTTPGGPGFTAIVALVALVAAALLAVRRRD